MSEQKKQMVNILAIDTATEACSVALQWKGQQFECFEECPREHTKKILPMVESILKKANVKLEALDAIAYGQGPGSFTGVRIGVAAAQGLAFGADLPLIGVSTLAAMANRVMRDQLVPVAVAAIDARMGEIYHAIYQQKDGLPVLVDEEKVIDAALLDEDNSLKGAAVGTGWLTYHEILSGKYPHVLNTVEIKLPHAYDMLDIAQNLYDSKNILRAEQATPVYLRDKVTWKKLPGRE
ncbi:MAG: tRNA threonylcarbamoyladenosine biosynthesis protein TsaB [Candidatus Celerinatantimonas neptuna]|nr:MAG: tRNA threonylcarbamoyladenosine biosynthesis protein TsaB [Candidatus Celerinatantimonas neptuna]